MIRTVERTSRHPRLCDACDGVIPAGSRYRVATASPGEIFADPDRWSRLYLHAEGYCLGGEGRRYDLAMEVEWREHKARASRGVMTVDGAK